VAQDPHWAHWDQNCERTLWVYSKSTHWVLWWALSKEPTTYLQGNDWANCFRAHKELTINLLGKFPLAPSVSCSRPHSRSHSGSHSCSRSHSRSRSLSHSRSLPNLRSQSCSRFPLNLSPLRLPEFPFNFISHSQSVSFSSNSSSKYFFIS
jgi:hypothetical protein